MVCLAFGFRRQRAISRLVSGHNATTLKQVMIYNAPNGNLAGTWQSGGDPATNAAGNILFVTGNGNFDASCRRSRELII